MVHKIKYLGFFLIVITCAFLAFFTHSEFETNLLKTIMPQNGNSELIKIADKSSSVIRVVFESKDEDRLEDLKTNFVEKIDKNYFEINKPDISKLMNIYLNHPMNFISAKTKKLLEEGKYDEIYESSMYRIYSPVQISSLDKDPYLLSDDFILSNKHQHKTNNIMDNKSYDFLSLKIKLEEGLSPALTNKKVSEIVKIQKELSNQEQKIYLSGSPIHSFCTSKNASRAVNFICLLSILLAGFLTYYYFKSIKILFPIGLSLGFGMLLGFSVTKVVFHNFQLITLVFASTLIGIGIDYSYHYFFSGKKDKEFVTNLSLSLLTTIISFSFLYLSGIELLKQISVFMTAGLIGIYLFVLTLFPKPNKINSENKIKIDKKYSVSALALIIFLAAAGFFRLNFNDTLTAFYSPNNSLKKAETLYNEVSGNNHKNTQIILVKGNSLDEIISKEEELTKGFENIDFISISKLLPSVKTQKENYELVKKLYNSNLEKFSEILTPKQIQVLKSTAFTPAQYNAISLPDFFINPQTSMIFIFSDTNIKGAINVKTDIGTYLKHYRKVIFKVFPLVCGLLFFIFTMIYGFKDCLKILTPQIVGIFSAAGLTLLITGELNLFSIIALFLVLGFTTDYSIFRVNPSRQTENAIFVSCITTSFSFLLLALCGFKLLTSIALVLFFGIISAYLAGYIVFEEQND